MKCWHSGNACTVTPYHTYTVRYDTTDHFDLRSHQIQS